MSDTRQELIELWTLDALLKKSPGMDLHISGLGLGIFAKYALDKQFRVEVIEIDPDVIALVEPQLRAAVEHPEYLTVIEGNALTWAPPKGKRYGAAWHDIWDEITLDNWPEYKLLRRRWGHWARVQGCWADWVLRRELRQEWKNCYY